MNDTQMQTIKIPQAMKIRLMTLLELLPLTKIQELIDFGDFLVSRYKTFQKEQRLGDRFAGVWQDDRTAEEIIADIQNSRVDAADRGEL